MVKIIIIQGEKMYASVMVMSILRDILSYRFGNRIRIIRDLVMKKTVTSKPHTSNTNQLLNLYIRNSKKQGLLLHVPPRPKLNNLITIIQHRFRVPPEHQILFHNGQQITTDGNQQIDVQDKGVIHMVDRRNIHRQITINVRRLNVPKVEQFRIPSSQIIQDFIVRSIQEEEAEKMFMVYTGRQLNRQRTFEEEFVENQSELYCLHEEQDQVRGQKRQQYEGKIREEADKKDKKKKMEEEADNILENYLPKDGQTLPQQKEIKEQEEEQKEQSLEKDQSEEKQINNEQALQPDESQQASGTQSQIKPNFFKKKSKTQQINIILHPHKKTPTEVNLSQLNQNNQNNFQQNQSGLNSQYFGDGSSISEIVANDSHNPESSKKIEEGSMFQSAYIGLNNQPSFVNQNQIPSRITESSQLRLENQSQNSSSRGSLNFDTKAPQMIYLPPDRHLTVLERQILQVTEESLDNTSQQTSNAPEKEEIAEQSPQIKKQGDIQNEHSAFEFGQIENHLLSASTQMRVGDPTSPVNKNPNQKNQILIQDESNNQEDPISPEFNKTQEHVNHEYVGVQLQSIAQQDEESQLQSRKNIENDRNTFGIVQEKERSTQTAHFNLGESQEIVNLYLLQQVNQNASGLSEVVEEKEEVQTNHPSSGSNFFSKPSSHVVNYQQNQYQFGTGQKSPNRPGIMSRQIERQNRNGEPLEEVSKSQLGKGKDYESVDKIQDDESQDLQLQIVDLPQEINMRQNLINLQSQIDLKGHRIDKIDEKQQKEGQNLDYNISKQSQQVQSNIDVLNNLISDLTDVKSNQPSQVYPSPEQLSPQKNNHDGSSNSSEVQIDTSLGDKNKAQNGSSSIHNLKESLQSLEQVNIKKTIASFSSGTKLFEQEVKTTPHKEQFSPGNYTFKADLTYFDPLQFYISQLNQGSSSK